jgi:hypothetical protein
MEFAIEQTDFASDKKTTIDFRPYVTRDSIWGEYLTAFEKIKIGLP